MAKLFGGSSGGYKDPNLKHGAGSGAKADPYQGKFEKGWTEKLTSKEALKTGYHVKGWKAAQDADAAKKVARIAAIKKAALSNKKYNVGTSTTADLSSGALTSGILGGGGGGYYTEGDSGGGFSFSDIPSIVWIILAVGAGWFLIKSSKGKGNIFKTSSSRKLK